MNTYRIPARRSQSLPILILFAALALFEIWMIASNGASAGYFIPLGFFILIIFYIVFKMMDRRPAVELNADAIHAREWKTHWTRWDEIEKIDLYEFRNIPFIQIQTRNENRRIGLKNLALQESEASEIISRCATMTHEQRQHYISELISNQQANRPN